MGSYTQDAELTDKFADLMFDLMRKYPGRSFIDIFKDASHFTGRNIWSGTLNNPEFVAMLEKYLNTHD